MTQSEHHKIFQNPIFVVLLALLCCALWGSAFPCIKIGYQWMNISGPGSQILFGGYRFFLAGVFTYLMGSVLERRPLRIKPSSIPFVCGQGLLQTTAQYVCFYIGVAHTTGAKGSVINTSSTFFAIFIAHFLMKSERITLQKIIGCIIGFSGIIIINIGPGAWDGGVGFLGEGMLLLASIAYGASSVTMKLISGREHPMTITAFQFLVGGALMIGIGFACGGSVTGFTLPSVLLLLYLALLSTIAFSLWAMLLKYNSVGRITIFGFSIPVFGVAFSAIILGEQIFSFTNLAALLLVSAGIIVVNLNMRKKPKTE